MKPKRPLQPTRPNLKPRKAKLKLPTLAAFKKLPLIERTKVFARWCAMQTGEYRFSNIDCCPLAQFGTAIMRKPAWGGSHDFIGAESSSREDIAVLDQYAWGRHLIALDEQTFPALTKRLKAHIAAQS